MVSVCAVVSVDAGVTVDAGGSGGGVTVDAGGSGAGSAGSAEGSGAGSAGSAEGSAWPWLISVPWLRAFNVSVLDNPTSVSAFEGIPCDDPGDNLASTGDVDNP